MKRLNLEPTDENVIAQFCNDSIGRNIDVLQFVSLLNSIDENCSIAVDALWGAGKTFFVKQVKMVLDAYNNFATSVSDSDKAKIVNTCETAYQCQEFHNHPQLCVYYDAWENDSDDEPVLSLVHSVMMEVSSTASFKEDMQPRNIAKILFGLADAFCGTQTFQLADAMKRTDYLESIKNGHSIRSRVNDFFNELFQEKGNRLVIIVDELDRCNPDYAVRLLERIKHYFSNKNITFVFAINSQQLQHTVKHHYGMGFDASRYLDRFFDSTIDLPPANMNRFYQSIEPETQYRVYKNICEQIGKSFNMQMREYVHFQNMVLPERLLQGQEYYPEGMWKTFSAMILKPFLVALRMTDKDAYVKFMSGEDGHSIQKIAALKSVASWYIDWLLLEGKETFERKTDSDTRKIVDLESKLQTLYDLIFASDSMWSPEQKLGQMIISKSARKDLQQTLSGWSDIGF